MHWIKTTLTCLTLLIAYELVCRFYPWPLDGVGHNAQIINQIKMEELEKNMSSCQTLIVGTSLSHGTPRPFRFPHCDMSLLGGDIVKQLEWLDMQPVLPKNIYIEGSAFFRQNLDLTWQPPLPFSDTFYLLQTKYQAPNLLLAAINKMKGQYSVSVDKSDRTNINKKEVTKQAQVDWLNSPIEKRQQRIIELVSKLRLKGLTETNVEFYFYPIADLEEYHDYTQLIAHFKSALSNAKIKFVDNYQYSIPTTDGIHPTPQALGQFFYWLLVNPWARAYHFSADWFTPHQEIFDKFLSLYASLPVNYLEVGVYEGRSFFWVVDHILKHPASKAWALDFFPDDLFKIFLSNRAASSAPSKVEALRGDSATILPSLGKNSFDLIYLDGSHVGKDVLRDLVNLFDLLNNDGLLLIDDYALLQDTLPSHLAPKIAVDAFLQLNIENLEVIYWGGENKRPLIIKKRAGPCDLYKIEFEHKDNFFNMCSNLNSNFAFDWSKQQLIDLKGTAIILSKDKLKQLKDFLLQREYRNDDQSAAFLENLLKDM